MKITLQFSVSVATWALSLSAHVQGVFGAELSGKGVLKALETGGLDIQRLTSAPSSCSSACQSLESTFANRTILPQESAYSGWTSAFWSNQQALVKPACIVQPLTNIEVSSIVIISKKTKCPFAIKSGGHAAFAGASNIAGGINIDLRLMREITLSADQRIAYIQPGNQWSEVYKSLEMKNLSVIGGRVSEIGTGGLTLGGGISFFSSQYGWACDNIESYELVTASGSILNVTNTTYPDLFWALRGGGNNFGIVTRFAYKTIRQGKMWGGQRYALSTSRSRAAGLKAMVNFGNDAPKDPKGALIYTINYALGLFVTAVSLEYADPVAKTPAVFAEFDKLSWLSSDTKAKPLSQITKEINDANPHGNRDTFWTATYKLDLSLATEIADIFEKETKKITRVSGLVPSCIYQVITKGFLENTKKKGGNALGLDLDGGPYLLFQLSYRWKNVADDLTVMKSADTILKAIHVKAKQKGLAVDYLYMNYASEYQDVIASYGKENKAKLISIAKKYDPDGVFQILQPGHFKLGGAPVLGP